MSRDVSHLVSIKSTPPPASLTILITSLSFDNYQNDFNYYLILQDPESKYIQLILINN